MTIQSQLQKIRQGKLAPVYLILGTEYALQEEAKLAITQAALQNPDDEMNKVVLDLKERPLADGIFEAESIPFLGERRLVILENPSFLTGEKLSGGPLHETDELLRYLKQPLDTSILVIVAPYEKLDERKKIVKELKKKAEVLDVSPLKEGAIRQFAKEALQEAGLAIGTDAFELLLTLTGYDFSKLQGEIGKLILYAADTKKITLADVNQLVPRTLQQNIFDLGDYMLRHDSQKSLQLFDDLLLMGEEPIKINGILLSQFRLYLQVKFLVSAGNTQAQIASSLKVHPYRVKLAMEKVRSLSLSYLTEIFDELVEQDLQMKQSVVDKKLAFELLILKISRAKVISGK